MLIPNHRSPYMVRPLLIKSRPTDNNQLLIWMDMLGFPLPPSVYPFQPYLENRGRSRTNKSYLRSIKDLFDLQDVGNVPGILGKGTQRQGILPDKRWKETSSLRMPTFKLTTKACKNGVKCNEEGLCFSSMYSRSDGLSGTRPCQLQPPTIICSFLI